MVTAKLIGFLSQSQSFFLFYTFSLQQLNLGVRVEPSVRFNLLACEEAVIKAARRSLRRQAHAASPGRRYRHSGVE
jgi:hypothetical protein